MIELDLIIPGLGAVPENPTSSGRRRLEKLLADSRIRQLPTGLLAAIRAAAGRREAGATHTGIEAFVFETDGQAPASSTDFTMAVQELPHGPVCALGDGVTASGWVCLAEPVALHAHTDHVTLGFPEALRLQHEEAESLAESIRSLVAADGLVVTLADPARWYLHGAAEGLAAGLPDAGELAGSRLDAALDVSGAHAATASLLTEIQMLFHDSAVNLRRESRGLPAVQGVWLSGGGVLAASAAKGETPGSFPESRKAPPELFGGPAYLRGLAVLAGQRPAPAPARFEDLPAGGDAGVDARRRVVVALPALPAAEESDAWERALADLQQAWLDPVERALRHGTVSRFRWWDAAGRGGERVRLRGRRPWFRWPWRRAESR